MSMCITLKKDLFVLFMYTRVCACMILCTSWEFICIMCLRVPTEARGHCPPGAGATGTCEPPDVGTGYQTQSLCKSNAYP